MGSMLQYSKLDAIYKEFKSIRQRNEKNASMVIAYWGKKKVERIRAKKQKEYEKKLKDQNKKGSKFGNRGGLKKTQTKTTAPATTQRRTSTVTAPPKTNPAPTQ